MSMLGRTLTLGALALGLGTSALAAQQKPKGPANYRWYIGGQGSVVNFETTGQTRGWLPAAGVHTLIIARRTGLLLSADEILGSDEVGFYPDATAPTGQREVRWNHIRRYSGVLMAFPWRQPIEPYFGIGGGIQHALNPQPMNTAGLTPDEVNTIFDQADDASSYGFLTALAGVQLRAGPVMLFGQVQGMTAPDRGNVFTGPSWTGSAGLRISLGSSREDQY